MMLKVNLGAAMLGLGHLLTRRAKTLVSQFGLGDTYSINIASRKPRCTRHADVERVQVSALASEIARLEHEVNVATPAAANLGIANRVLDDPLVDGACLVDIGGCALRRLERSSFQLFKITQQSLEHSKPVA